MNLRRAKLDEINILNKFAFNSESYWGEDEKYMNFFSEKYKVTENMIRDDYVYIMEDKEIIIGFFVILKNYDMPELELFYIERSLIGKGYGTLLWNNMLNLCRKKGIVKFRLISSIDVSNFYKKLGAKEILKKESLLKVGRIVSKLEYKIEDGNVEV